MEPFLGEIKACPYGYAPRGWLRCEGQLLPIAQNTALFSLLGKMYGGDGKNNFGLPDLRGRSIIGAGQGTGLTNRVQGSKGGAETVTLNSLNQIPAHTHPIGGQAASTLKCSSGPAATTTPVGDTIAANATGTPTLRFNTADPDAPMKDGAIELAGETEPNSGGSPHNNMQPYIAITYCIATQGLYPARS